MTIYQLSWLPCSQLNDVYPNLGSGDIQLEVINRGARYTGNTWFLKLGAEHMGACSSTLYINTTLSIEGAWVRSQSVMLISTLPSWAGLCRWWKQWPDPYMGTSPWPYQGPACWVALFYASFISEIFHECFKRCLQKTDMSTKRTPTVNHCDHYDWRTPQA